MKAVSGWSSQLWQNVHVCVDSHLLHVCACLLCEGVMYFSVLVPQRSSLLKPEGVNSE